MQFSVLEKTGQSRLVLKVTDASLAQVNSLRRAILSQLPAFAVDEVDFYENNSALYNEYLANRIGLIPLTFEEKVKDDAKISLTLNVQGPGIIYSKDLVSSDEKIKPVNDHFPIVELGENQKLRIEAWAVKGVAKRHAKFQRAHAAYGLMPFFKVKKNSPKLKEYYALLPKECFDKDGEPAAYKCLALEQFAIDNPDIAEWGLKEEEYLFTVESFNNVSAGECVKEALTLMSEHVSEVLKQVK